MGVLAIMAGISTRLIFHFVEMNTIAPVNLIFGVFPFIAGYFILTNPPDKKVVIATVSLFAISGIYLNLLPLEYKDSIFQAYLAPASIPVVAGRLGIWGK